MVNQEIANILYEIGYLLEMEEVAFKPQAYEKAAIVLENLKESIEDIYKIGGIKALVAIPGVGTSIAQKIEEFLKTGRIRYYEELKEKVPVNIGELTAIEGVGPKMVKTLYQELGIRSLKDLEEAIKSHKVSSLFGFGEKKEQNILQGIRFLKKSKGRFLLGRVLPIAQEIQEVLSKLKEVRKISSAGSLRRKKETVGDIDFLVVAQRPEKVMNVFVSLPGVMKIWQKGGTKSSIRLTSGIDVDLRVVPEKSYGSALQYFTGSKEHNIALRKIAIDKNLKLNEYGLFRGSKMIAGASEEEIYQQLGMAWIEPELRENSGEIEAALNNKLPKLLKHTDIRGDLHCHSNWDGGENSIKEMAERAMQMGYQYLGIADHTKFLRIERGLNEQQLTNQRKEIDEINQKSKRTLRGEAGGFSKNQKFNILQGCEANILNDGSIDIKDEALEKLDFAIAGVHSNFKLSKSQMTERIIKAMKNPNIKIISHPLGRILQKRDEYQIDFDKILRAARETKTILEINAFPLRLDLNDVNIKRAKEAGVKMVINTDAHQKDQMRFMELGIAQARRGWAEKKDIINTCPVKNLLAFLK